MMFASELVEIDGSFLEGGGQILRIATALSCILKRPIRIKNIRANRPKPGLAPQHLTGLNLLQQITAARVVGNYIQSTEVEFYPGVIKSGFYKVDAKTAASITLIAQAALPVLAFGNEKSEILLMGGTNVGMSPQVDFMTEVLRRNLELFGFSFDFELIHRGYYPRGGGKCTMNVPAIKSLKAVNLTNFGNIVEIEGWCFVAGNLPVRLADEIKNIADKVLDDLKVPVVIESYKEAPSVAKDNAAGIILKATTDKGCVLGSDALGGKHVVPQELGEVAGSVMKETIKNRVCVDSHVQDQLIIFMALSYGTSRILTGPLTDHTRTAMHVTQLMIPQIKFETEERDGKVLITCKGLGFQNENQFL